MSILRCNLSYGASLFALSTMHGRCYVKADVVSSTVGAMDGQVFSVIQVARLTTLGKRSKYIFSHTACLKNHKKDNLMYLSIFFTSVICCH